MNDRVCSSGGAASLPCAAEVGHDEMLKHLSNVCYAQCEIHGRQTQAHARTKNQAHAQAQAQLQIMSFRAHLGSGLMLRA